METGRAFYVVKVGLVHPSVDLKRGEEVTVGQRLARVALDGKFHQAVSVVMVQRLSPYV